MSKVPWKVLVTVPTMLAVAVTFGYFFVLTGDTGSLAIASGAAGALAGYLGKLNGTP